MERALFHLQNGEIDAARAIVEAKLRRHPGDGEALRLLGKIVFHQGDAAGGIGLMTKALAACPAQAEIPYELGVMWLGAGGVEPAVAAFGEALRRQPGHLGALFNLAWALRRQGQGGKAAETLRHLLRLEPGHADAWFNLGNIHLDAGDAAEAVEAFRHVLALQPCYQAASINLAAALQMQGAVDEAVGLLNDVLAADPDSIEAANTLGNLLTRIGRLEAAAAVFQAALRRHPEDATLLCNHALAQAMTEPGAAAATFLAALNLAPGMVEAWNGLGTARIAGDDLSGAEQAFRHAIALRADYGDALGNLGKVLALQGRNGEALTCMKAAVAAAPDDAMLGSNLLQLMRYMDTLAPADVFAEHVLFGQRQEALATPVALPPPIRAEARRRLRIGYVSPDFCDHATMLFFEPVLSHHDKNEVEIFCYHTHNRVDGTTRRLMALADHWRPLAHLPPAAAAALIRRDGIDILVDLAGHTAGNGLPVFARKPAPIQATWLGYPGTSGLSRMDYRLTDAGTDPVNGGNAAFHTEELVRLRVAAAFRPPSDAPEVGPLPVLRRGRLRFGAFNKMTKVNEPVIRAWGRILTELPEAELSLIIPGGEREAVRGTVHEAFARHGIAKDRLLIDGTKPLRQFLQAVAETDIALDSFPYCGGTTSLLTLWMGVPVVCREGGDSASATTRLLLASIGLDSLAAADEDAYVRIACTLAADTDRLAEMRASLRGRLRKSSPFDERLLVGELEDTYRHWWWRLIAERTRGLASGAAGYNPALESSADPHWRQVLFSFAGSEPAGSVPFADSLGSRIDVFGAVAAAPPSPGGIAFDRHAYVTVPTDASWHFGAGDFTVECLCWIPSSVCLEDAGGLTLLATFGDYEAAENGWNLLLDSDGRAYGWITQRGTVLPSSDYVQAGPSAAAIRYGEWNHVAMVRHGDRLTVFLNGTGISTDGPAGFVVWPASAPLSLGANAGGTNQRFMQCGYLDGIRVTKGVARYGEDFDPPTGRHSDINGTQL